MASRVKGGKGKSVPGKRRLKSRTKKARAKKPYGRDHHRHGPGDKAGPKSPKAKLHSETTGVDEDLDYGAATRGHRWSRSPAVYVGGVPDRRQSFGRRATDKAPPESFSLQGEGPPDQRRR